ncbi:VTT domain-containing protein [Halomarina rubra]|uniref:VTT domain-containing protein n=1 Tax=Halomarina rubra TaxID=2071873 RepID=A0ABD6AVU2_9EURY|nr:VTT domain-containing protein [Halomarina rubra]
MERATRRQLSGLALAVGVVAVASLAVSPERVLRAMAAVAADPLVFAGVVLGAALLRPVVAWPMTPLVGVVGYVLGVTPLALALGLAVATGTAAIPYLLARRYRPSEGVLGWLADAGADCFETAGDTRGVVAARLAPLPTDVVSYGAGLSNVSARPYVLGTALGEAPWVVAALLAGSSMETLTTEGLSAGLPLVVAGLAVGSLLLSGPLYRQLSTGTVE